MNENTELDRGKTIQDLLLIQAMILLNQIYNKLGYWIF